MYQALPTKRTRKARYHLHLIIRQTLSIHPRTMQSTYFLFSKWAASTSLVAAMESKSTVPSSTPTWDSV